MIDLTVIASALNFIGLACMITSSLLKGKNMKLILLFVCFGNATVSAAYLITGAYAGGIACGIGAVTTLINAVIQIKGKTIPKWLIYTYAVIYALPQVYIFIVDPTVWQTLIALVASVSFTLCIGAENGKGYRIFTIVNMLLWCSYDALVPAYSTLFFTHLPLLLFTLAGMVIYDRKKD